MIKQDHPSLVEFASVPRFAGDSIGLAQWNTLCVPPMAGFHRASIKDGAENRRFIGQSLWNFSEDSTG